MKPIYLILVLAAGAAAFLFLRRRQQQTPLGPPNPNVPDPRQQHMGLCSSLVTLGATGAGAYFGGPQGAGLAGGVAAGGGASLACKAASVLGNGAIHVAQTVARGTAKVGKTAYNAVGGVSNTFVKVGGVPVAINPVGATVNTVKAVAHPLDTVKKLKFW